MNKYTINEVIEIINKYNPRKEENIKKKKKVLKILQNIKKKNNGDRYYTGGYEKYCSLTAYLQSKLPISLVSFIKSILPNMDDIILETHMCTYPNNNNSHTSKPLNNTKNSILPPNSTTPNALRSNYSNPFRTQILPNRPQSLLERQKLSPQLQSRNVTPSPPQAPSRPRVATSLQAPSRPRVATPLQAPRTPLRPSPRPSPPRPIQATSQQYNKPLFLRPYIKNPHLNTRRLI
jgi:hypothetical protein